MSVYKFKEIPNNDTILVDTNDHCTIKENMVINNYTIIKYLGEGAFSQVWKAFDKNLNIDVVLKIHKSNKKNTDIAMNEYNILKNLNHPNIITAYTSFIYKQKYLVIVLEYLGDSLSTCKHHFRGDYNDDSDSDDDDKKNIQCMPNEVIKKIMYQIFDGLSYLHNDKKIIHTDLKLGNIMLTKKMHNINSIDDFHIKIIDFGTSHSTNSKCKYHIGTYEYNAPEMIIGYPYNTSIDIWSIGCIYFEILTGYCLFDCNKYYNNSNSSNSSNETLYSSNSESDDEEVFNIENLLLAMISKTIGKIPGKIYKRGKFFEVFYNNKGNLKQSPAFLEEMNIHKTLTHNYNFTDEYATINTNFILLMLNNYPDKRITAKKILSNSYFN